MQAFHFFASSVAEFQCDNDIKKLIKYMDKRGLEYNLWYVPKDVNGEYDIKSFKPDVEGVIFLGQYQPK